MHAYEGATVEGVHPVADELFLLRVRVPAPLCASYARSGQYTWLRLGGHEAPFALAQAPGDGEVWEYLVRESSPLTAQLRLLQPGDRLDVTQAMGPGFPLEKARGQRLLLVGTGTGLAPLRAVIQRALADAGAHPSLDLILGVRSQRHVPLSDDLAAWKARGVGVTLVASEEGPPTWSGPRGFVHEHVPFNVGKETWAFLCGHPQMVENMKAVLTSRGVPLDRIALNL